MLSCSQPYIGLAFSLKPQDFLEILIRGGGEGGCSANTTQDSGGRGRVLPTASADISVARLDLMGRDVDYQPCPIARKPEGKMRKLVFVLSVVILVLSVFFLTFAVLYLSQRYSEPAKQLQECRSKMQNQSSQMEAQIVSLGRRMEETQEAATNQAGIWSHQMETMNKSLTETQENWHSCQKQLTALQDNFTSTEAKERSQTEAIKNLQQQLTEKSKQLNDEERKSQEERKHHEAEIQQLRERLAQKQQDDSNGAGGSRDFAGLSITLLTILMAGFLSV